MTVADERVRVPAIDSSARERLSEALDRAPVVAAMLFGSQATGEAGPLSDVDVGVWHEPELDPAARARLRLELADAAARAIGTSEVDVVLLNGATPLIRHRAVRDGLRLVERDRAERVRLETRAVLDYLDTAPLRAQLGRGLRRRIAEGRFGRR